MKFVVFISSGLGNAVLLNPLVNRLKNAGHQVSAVFDTPYDCDQLYEHSNLFDHKMVVDSNWDYTKVALGKLKRHKVAILDHFALRRRNKMLARFIAMRLVTQKSLVEFLNSSGQDNTRHNAMLNLALGYKYIKDQSQLTPADFDFHYSPKALESQFELPKQYIVLQPGSGNNKTPYKSWPITNWLKVIEKLKNYPFVILGDRNEMELSEQIKKRQYPNVTNLIGRTGVGDLPGIIGKSKLLLGHDSGLMHIAAGLNIPTCTIWGASDYYLYGYEQLFPRIHKVIANSPDCWPCNSWIQPNQSRVSDPMECPDFKCIRSISAEKALPHFKAFIKSHW